MAICPACGVRVERGKDEADWRQQVREKVERHKEKKRREQSRHDDDARQLSIFPEVSTDDDEELAARARRAEIRVRVEQRLSKHREAPAVVSSVDVGEVSLGGHAAAAAIPEPAASDELSIDSATNAFSPVDEVPPSTLEPFIAFGLASPGERILGGLVDLAFVSLIQLTLFYLTTHLVAQRLGALPTSAVVAMVIVGAVLAAGYFQFFWSLSGQTLGKLLTGGRVVASTGGALGFRRAALRLVGTVLSLLPFGVGFLGLWTDPERRGWHDRLAGSKVVRA